MPTRGNGSSASAWRSGSCWGASSSSPSAWPASAPGSAARSRTASSHRTASTTALYVDSLIAPSLQDLATGDTLSPPSVDRLDWLFTDTPLGQEVALFQVWDRDGRIVYSTVPGLVGQQFPIEPELASSLAGEVTADVGQAEGGADLPSDVSRQNLIEIYSPVRNRDTGGVIAAAEFYFATDTLQGDLAMAQRRSWLIVGGATLLIYLLLATFIGRVSDTIRRQQRALATQVTQLTEVVRQNQELHERVRGAAARTAALNERFLRRFSVELHDGPAQDISLALLRLDHVAALAGEPDGNAANHSELERELDLIQGSLRRSLQDVRATSSGLLLPHLGALSVGETLDHVMRGHQRRTGAPVERDDARSAGAGAAGDEDRALPHRAGGAHQRLATRQRHGGGGVRHRRGRSIADRGRRYWTGIRRRRLATDPRRIWGWSACASGRRAWAVNSAWKASPGRGRG